MSYTRVPNPVKTGDSNTMLLSGLHSDRRISFKVDFDVIIILASGVLKSFIHFPD